MNGPPLITIRRHDGEELPFRVTVDPQPEAVDMSSRFADHRAAYGFAIGVRMSLGGSVIDLADDKDGEAAALIGTEGANG